MNDEVAEKAMRALRGDDPRAARNALARILEEAPERLDVQHAMAVTELRLGEAASARARLDAAEAQARAQADDTAAALMGNLLLTKAAACEDLYELASAEACYREVLSNEEGNPRAATGLAYLLFACGRAEDGAKELERYVKAALDDPTAIEGNGTYLAAWKKLVEEDVHPRMFLEAHRGSYVEFFDHHAEKMAEKGWIAEAARMQRDDEGNVVPVIPEGARPYAAVRVDLVDPTSGQAGLVGDQPMIVALAGFEPLARAPLLQRWPERDHPFPVWISSQAPWDQLPVQIALAEPSAEAAGQLDAVIGDWYLSGWEGAFGTQDSGRFHYISDPESPHGAIIVWNVDCGRASLDAIPDLLRRLAVLHDRHPLRQVLLGRGFVPQS